jgi:hypothetical protein
LVIKVVAVGDDYNGGAVHHFIDKRRIENH